MEEVNAVRVLEHVLGATETQSLGAKAMRDVDVVQTLGTGVHFDALVLVRPLHHREEVVVRRAGGGRHGAHIEHTAGAVHSYEVPKLRSDVVGAVEAGDGLVGPVDAQVGSACDSCLALAANHYSRVGGQTTAQCHHTVRCLKQSCKIFISHLNYFTV